VKRRGGETHPQTFATYAAAFNNTPDLDLPDPNSVPADVPLLAEESKIACATGMLLCLDRKQRLIFTLGEILGVSDTVGSEILDLTADNSRPTDQGRSSRHGSRDRGPRGPAIRSPLSRSPVPPALGPNPLAPTDSGSA
jgi:hypothetical protein